MRICRLSDFPEMLVLVKVSKNKLWSTLESMIVTLRVASFIFIRYMVRHRVQKLRNFSALRNVESTVYLIGHIM